LAAPDNELFVSVASIWEIAIKANTGKLKFPVDRLTEMLGANHFEALPIAPHHALAAGGLPRHHNDPFDRMLIAQARTEGLVLVSSDAAIARYDVELLGQ
jgi:PIN domain nuclease of toxin-antitoxin system